MANRPSNPLRRTPPVRALLGAAAVLATLVSGLPACSSDGSGGGNVAASCNTGAACAGDSDCGAGARCRTTDHACVRLYCLGLGQSCTASVMCASGSDCLASSGASDAPSTCRGADGRYDAACSVDGDCLDGLICRHFHDDCLGKGQCQDGGQQGADYICCTQSECAPGLTCTYQGAGLDYSQCK